MMSAMPHTEDAEALKRRAVSFDDENASVSSIDGSSSHLSSDAITTPVANRRFSDTTVLLVPRIISIFFFLLAGAGVAAGMQILLSKENERTLENQLDTLADEILLSTESTFHFIHGLLASLSTTITAASLEGKKAEWPMFTHDHFDQLGRSFLDNTATPLVAWSPIVEGATEVDSWEAYSSTSIRTTNDAEFFIPVWQTESEVIDPTAVNFDLFSNQLLKPNFEAVIDTRVLSFANFVNSTDLYGDYLTSNAVDERSPESLLMIPLFSDLSESSDATVEGIVLVVIPWDSYFRDIFHDGTERLDVVVDDGSCGSKYTFFITGPEVFFVGKGDLHDTKYSSSARIRKFTPDTKTSCQVSFTVYPTHELALEFEPTTTMIPIIGLTIGFSILFILYDVLLRRREQKVVTSAARTNAIVSALFPGEFRDRLFGRNNKQTGESTMNLKKTIPESSKFRLKSYLAKEDQKVKANEKVNVSLAAETLASIGNGMYDTKPIADLFPNTTIMFADIAGFTAWSSVREPSQVFTLLETVYQAFDTIAKRRRVFKVETVGDCYVAVTGLPEVRKDHAFAMAKFARECLVRFNELSKQLEVVLGPDTGDLAMRAGLHSGPVTAGVLRGDKSRFQLFGDTVNTAARIESSGKRNRVHLSSETAMLLIEAGKPNWVQIREDLVSAKGKGEIQTYWLHSPQDAIQEAVDRKAIPPSPSLPIPNRATLDSIALETLEKSLPPKILRLVKWNVEILKKLLQAVIAKQQGQTSPKKWGNQVEKREKELMRQKQCLAEVAEIIALPKYDHKAHVGTTKVEIPEAVVNELRHFVCMIASMHQANHFHNFEHASHVTMSVSKLLSRIVAPDEVMNGKYGHDIAMSLHDHTYGITSDPLTQFSIVLAALIHDVDHSGVSNFQLIKENAKIASFFKEKSVAEQNSIVLAWDQLMLPKYTTLRRCIYTDQSELDRFRQIIINNVLATDIFDKELQGLRRNRWDNAFQKYSTPHGSRQSTILDDTNRKATIVMEHLIQASDVSHTMQHWHIYQKWNERLFAEMAVAYQHGRMDKDPTLNWYEGELGFFDNYVIPLAKKLKECGVFGVSCDEYLNYALENRREWENKGKEVVATMVQKYGNKTKVARRNSLSNSPGQGH